MRKARQLRYHCLQQTTDANYIVVGPQVFMAAVGVLQEQKLVTDLLNAMAATASPICGKRRGLVHDVVLGGNLGVFGIIKHLYRTTPLSSGRTGKHGTLKSY